MEILRIFHRYGEPVNLKMVDSQLPGESS